MNIIDEFHNELIFTRYLYIKDEVKNALLVSLLAKNREESLFWGFELYKSGFKHEFINFMMLIYYDFYATLNPYLGIYLLKIFKEWINAKTNIVEIFVKNLLMSSFNLDVFWLRQTNSLFDFEEEPKQITNFKNILLVCVKQNNYLQISNVLLLEQTGLDSLEIYDVIKHTFKLLNITLTKTLNNHYLDLLTNCQFNHLTKLVLLSITMVLCMKYNAPRVYKNTILLTNGDCIKYNTLSSEPRKMLSIACKHEIDGLKQQCLFKLKRNEYDVCKLYNDDWLFYASGSPVWLKRIKRYNGLIDSVNKKVLFKSDEFEENFYNRYAYEPNEQALSTKQKSIMDIDNNYNWEIMYNKYKELGLVTLHPDIINDLKYEKIIYDENKIYDE